MLYCNKIIYDLMSHLLSVDDCVHAYQSSWIKCEIKLIQEIQAALIHPASSVLFGRLYMSTVNCR